jgi:hypothetical protein
MYWNSLRELQRLLDSARPMQEEIRRLHLMYDQLSRVPYRNDLVAETLRAQDQARDVVTPLLMRAQDILDEHVKTQTALADFSSMLPDMALLRAAVQPLLDIRALGVNIPGVFDAAERLNVNISEAAFLAELEFSGGPNLERQETTEDVVRQEAEAQLVEIAPPETVDALRAVQFAPIVLLDRALRHPGMMREMDPRTFEAFIASLIEQLGFEDVTLTPSSGDEGRDVLATQRIHGLTILFAFECKRYAPDRPVGPQFARALLGTISHGATRANKGVLVTTSRFTPAARSFILTEPSLEGREFDGIIEWLREYGLKKKAT